MYFSLKLVNLYLLGDFGNMMLVCNILYVAKGTLIILRQTQMTAAVFGHLYHLKNMKICDYMSMHCSYIFSSYNF